MTVGPIAQPDTLKGGPTSWQTGEDSPCSGGAIPLAHFVRPSPLKGGPMSWQT